MAKYLNEKEIDNIIGEIILDKDFQTMSQDSYNEESIAKKIASLSPKDLCCAAINMSTVGFGNQKYGQYRVGDNIISIQTLFQKYNIKYNNQRSAILRDDELTANRLCRFFRHKIRKYILENNFDTYMWRKYSTRDKAYRHVCFRGGEYLEDLNKQEATYLLLTVKEMDKKLGTSIADRVMRVYDAKNTPYEGKV